MATATETKVTEKQSSIAIQNLLTITVSEVLYSRGLLPKDNFCRVKMAGNYLHKMDDPAEGDGSKVAVLSRKAPFDIFILVTTMWLKKDVCEAMRKKVLQSLIVGIYSSAKCRKKDLIESYSFVLSDTKDNGYQLVSEIKVSIRLKPHALTLISLSSTPPSPHKTGGSEARPKIARTTGDVVSSMEPIVRTLQSLLTVMYCCNQGKLFACNRGKSQEPVPERHYVSFQICLKDGSTKEIFETSSDFQDDTRMECELPGHIEEIPIGRGILTEHHSLSIKVNARRSAEVGQTSVATKLSNDKVELKNGPREDGGVSVSEHPSAKFQECNPTLSPAKTSTNPGRTI